MIPSTAEILGFADLHLGDCLQLLPTLPENSIDSCVTDPPYGLTQARPGGRSDATRGAVMGGFMGMKWDHGVPGVPFWTEVLRVLKPGAHLLAFGGTRTYHRLTCAIEDAGFEIRDGLGWLYGSGFPKSLNITGGFGTALKPAWEPIVLARKPLIGTVAQNFDEYGAGLLNIDGCRVAYLDDADRASATPQGKCTSGNIVGGGVEIGRNEFERPEQKGRWPANILHDGSDDVLGVFPQSTGQLADASSSSSRTGSAARFFYCAKATKADRNAGCAELDHVSAGEATGGRAEGSAGLNSPRAGAGRTNGAKNHHPTVKPHDLMRYLCRLITPPKGVILDPFMGSGSTGLAAMKEGFRYIGIELEAEYMAIARARIDA